MVSTSLPSACTAAIVQDVPDLPSRSTVQAPQWLVSQSICGPVRLRSSLSKWISKVRGSTSTETLRPLTVIVTFILPSSVVISAAPCQNSVWMHLAVATVDPVRRMSAYADGIKSEGDSEVGFARRQQHFRLSSTDLFRRSMSKAAPSDTQSAHLTRRPPTGAFNRAAHHDAQHRAAIIDRPAGIGGRGGDCDERGHRRLHPRP